MKNKILIILLTILYIFSFSSCGKSDEYEGYKEVYNVQSKYYFYVQPQYEDSVSNLGYSNTTIVRYTTQAYAMLTVVDYFDDLSYDEIGGLTREDFSLGNPALDSTFNSRKYIQKYFESYLSSSNSYLDISQVEKITVNEHDFWLCHCYYYESDFNPTTEDPIDNLKGEGYLYYTIYDGITYFINVNSVDSFISETEEAQNFINNFYIGTRLQSTIRIVWLILGILLLIDVIFVLSVFFKISIDPAVIIEKIRITLQSLLGNKKYNSNEFDEALSMVKLDTALDRIEYEPTIEDEIFVKLKKSEIYLDEILGRCAEESAAELTVYEHLDIILGRTEKYPKAVFKEVVREPIPVVDSIYAIYRGEFNEEFEHIDFKPTLTTVQYLDVILGRCAGFKYAPTTPTELSGFAVKMQKTLQANSEKRSLSRIIKAEKKAKSIVEKAEKKAAKIQEKKIAQERKYNEKYAKIFNELDSKYQQIGYNSFVPDLKKSDISDDDIVMNLDIILGRTLFSKLDAILERTNWVYSPKYSGIESEQVVQRENALKNVSLAKQNRETYMASRIANVSDRARTIYLDSLSDLGNGSSVLVSNAIKNGELEHNYDEPAVENIEYNNLLTNGSGSYQNYIKTEKAIQKFIQNCKVMLRKTVDGAKNIINSISKKDEINKDISVND